MGNKQSSRLVFIDLLKGLVLLIMIEVHVFNSLLLLQFKEASWFSIVNFINGLVAPSFLFASGFTFILSTSKTFDSKFDKTIFLRKLKRISVIFLLGYVLRLPYLNLTDLINKSSELQMNIFLSVDILQCIAVGLFIFVISSAIFNKEKSNLTFLIIATFITILISPVMWKIQFDNFMHVGVANYFNRINGSLFPLFPWIAFIFSGGIAAHYYLILKKSGETNKYFNSILITGVLFTVIGYFVYMNLSGIVFSGIIPHPFFFIERLGIILFLLYFLNLINNIIDLSNSFLVKVSKESLIVYFLHLELIYLGFFNGKSLATVYYEKLNLLEASGVTLIIILSMIAAAYIWNYVKIHHKQYATYSGYILLIGGITYFILG
ncbi:MAG: heparan-alpha-glucosaminide N-acetyltransferase domain-containing protein [Melioribacteraceae bacterium]